MEQSGGFVVPGGGATFIIHAYYSNWKRYYICLPHSARRYQPPPAPTLRSADAIPSPQKKKTQHRNTDCGPMKRSAKLQPRNPESMKLNAQPGSAAVIHFRREFSETISFSFAWWGYFQSSHFGFENKLVIAEQHKGGVKINNITEYLQNTAKYSLSL
ncbi:unnamed protein product [Arctogadus glacialis]